MSPTHADPEPNRVGTSLRADPVFLVVVPPEVQPAAAVRRAAELARLSGGSLHLCAFVYDARVDAHSAASRPPVVDLARRVVLDEYNHRLRKLAAELTRPRFSVECEVLWAPVAHEAILAKAIQIGASCVVKDVRRESVLRRTLFTPLDWTLIRLLPCDLMLVGPHSPPRLERVLAAVDVIARDADDAQGLNERIVAAAQTLAEYANARLDLVSVAPGPEASGGRASAVGTQYAQRAAHHLEVFRGFAERLRVPAERRHRLLGAPAEAIAKIAEDLSADIAVVGSVQRDGWERPPLGGTAETLLQQLKSDLLVVKPGAFQRTVGRRIDLDAAYPGLAAEQPRAAAHSLR